MRPTTPIAARPLVWHDLAAMLTGLQMRAARALLRWSHQKLADESGIGIATIQRAEGEDGVPGVQARTLNAIQTTLERAGIIFLDPGRNEDGGPGVRLKKS